MEKSRASTPHRTPASVRARAAAFAHTREQRAAEISEDYVELINQLHEQCFKVRSIDLARHFGVSSATVNKVLARLVAADLVVTAPYQGVTLTELGARRAAACRARHHIVYSFLKAIGVNEENAHADSEGIEHHVSPQTLAALARLTKRFTREHRQKAKAKSAARKR